MTKQGSNRFSYDASYYGQPSRMTSQPLLLPVPAGSQPVSGYERVTYRDFTTNLGGPVRRDHLWFFAGYQYRRDYDSQAGTDPKYPGLTQQDNVFGKLTWQFRPGLQLLQSFHNEFWVSPDRPTLVTPFEATARHHASVPATTFGQLTQTVSSNTMWDVRDRTFRVIAARRFEPGFLDHAWSIRPRDRRLQWSPAADWWDHAHSYGRARRRSATISRPSFPADQQWKVGLQNQKSANTHQAQRHSRPASGSSTTTGSHFRRFLAIRL